MNNEERLKTEVETYFWKQEVENKANADLNEHVERLIQLYQNQYSTRKPIIAVFEYEIIKVMLENHRTHSTVHAELFVASAIRKHILQGIGKDNVERLSTLLKNLADGPASRSAYKGKANERYVFKYQKFSKTTEATQSRQLS